MSKKDQLHETIQIYVQKLEQFADRLWYAPLIGILAALDNIIIFIPNDGILIASSMLIPKRWALFALSVSIGSTIGAIALSGLVEHQGLPWILDFFPGVQNSLIWTWTESFFNTYGLLVVFLVAVSPIPQQPVVILAALAHTPIVELTVLIFLGRFIKFMVMAFLGSHSPGLVKRIWGIKSELKDAGIKIE